MAWPSNYCRMAAATMFTLFFAGNDFAPNFIVEGLFLPAAELLTIVQNLDPRG